MVSQNHIITCHALHAENLSIINSKQDILDLHGSRSSHTTAEYDTCRPDHSCL